MIWALVLERCALFGYLLAAAAFLVFALRRNKKAAAAANTVLAIGFGLQTLGLIAGAASLGQLPVFNLGQALAFFGWAVAGAHLALFWKFRLYLVGAAAAPASFLLVLAGILLPGETTAVDPMYRSLWLTLHLGTVFIGYGFFALAFAGGLLYLAQERQIKSKRTGAVFRRLPSLAVLDNLNYHCLTLGFVFMTLGIITGAVLSWTSFGRYWRWDPKEVWSLILWLVYAALLHQRLTVGWRGRRAAIMSIIGFLVLLFTFAGVSLLLPSYHSFEALQQLTVP